MQQPFRREYGHETCAAWILMGEEPVMDGRLPPRASRLEAGYS